MWTPRGVKSGTIPVAVHRLGGTSNGTRDVRPGRTARILLKTTRITRGCPKTSLRNIAEGSNCGKSTANKLLAGKGVPERKVTLSIIQYLGGEREEWESLVDEALAAQDRLRKTRRHEPQDRRSPAATWGRTIARIAIAATVVAIVQYAIRALLPGEQAGSASPNSDLPIVGRLHCALVSRDHAPVYRTPDINGAILKWKPRQASITYDDKYEDRTVNGAKFRAVRTPQDPPGYHWILIKDLQDVACGP
jgi:hypothetical protein